MTSYIQQESTNADPSIDYNPYLRSYSLRIVNSDYGTHESMQYCPWCGTKLPKDLDGVWSKVLREEYGIIDPNVTERDKIPSEFKTDEWWKKRGL